VSANTTLYGSIARDTRLGRDVAIEILPGSFALDDPVCRTLELPCFDSTWV